MGTAEYKTQAREALHEALANPASYTLGDETYPTAEQTEAGLSLTVRWHNKIRVIGERSSDDVGVVEGINRLVFHSGQLADLGLTLERYATVAVPSLDKVFRLEYLEESDGPQNVYWSVIEL